MAGGFKLGSMDHPQSPSSWKTRPQYVLPCIILCNYSDSETSTHQSSLLQLATPHVLKKHMAIDFYCSTPEGGLFHVFASPLLQTVSNLDLLKQKSSKTMETLR